MGEQEVNYIYKDLLEKALLCILQAFNLTK